MIVLIAGLFTTNIFYYKSRTSSNTPISGFAIGDNVLFKINMSLVAFVAQWIILLLIVLFAYSKFLKHRKEEDAKIADFVLPKIKSRSQTHLDTFYDLLKIKKSLSITTISKAFRIPKEMALDWAKILESDELVIIEYPAFSDPEVIINENKLSILSNK